MALALAFRVLFMLAMPRVLDTADAVHYLEAAKHLSAGSFLKHDPKIPVLYPALGAMLSWLLSDFEQACTAVSLLASVLAIWPLHTLAFHLHGRAVARLAGVTLAIWPWMADYGCRVGNEALGLFCWLWAVVCFASAQHKGARAMALAAVPFFALHLTRAEGLVLWSAAPLGAALLVPAPFRGWLRRLLPFLVSSLVLLGINTLYVRAHTGAATANYRIRFIVQEFDWLRFGDTAQKILFDVYPVMLGPVLLLFLGAGFFGPKLNSDSVKRRAQLTWYLLFFVLVQTVASWFVLSPAPRYLMAPIAVLSLWSAAGMVAVSQQCGSAITRALPAAALVLTMLFNAAVTVGSEHLGRSPREPREYKLAGEWMRANLEPGLVFTRKPQAAYYAGMPSTGPAQEDSLERALERARQAGARYLLVDERYGIPGMRPLLQPQNAPDSLRLLCLFDEYPQARVVLYEWNDTNKNQPLTPNQAPR